MEIIELLATSSTSLNSSVFDTNPDNQPAQAGDQNQASKDR